MSKKTNAEKMARARAEKQKRRLIRRRHPRGRLNPALTLPADWTGPDLPIRDVFGGIIDIALGHMFVRALRETGIRDKVVDMLFSAPEEETAEGSD